MFSCGNTATAKFVARRDVALSARPRADRTRPPVHAEAVWRTLVPLQAPVKPTEPMVAPVPMLAFHDWFELTVTFAPLCVTAAFSRSPTTQPSLTGGSA